LRATGAGDIRAAGVVESPASSAAATRHDEGCSHTERGDAAELDLHSEATRVGGDPDVRDLKSGMMSRRSCRDHNARGRAWQRETSALHWRARGSQGIDVIWQHARAAAALELTGHSITAR